ncbi:hypothetical protein BC477_13570 [Clavibacter michiganensis subsp. michiganensis]|uniref:Uncharacterized protein n=1 Tax=Clavibacter michiganensis subsp. michiganensis TaxID=33013 RepID=A0A251XJ29_CLAMM|nr:hypothetical protein BC477_13570 [Clavibacter michiganensis subsp. michiganensis]OUE02826.1 hypothetical protein CMMCAS07_12475 [Clavibacter michiganensis subsp. michiganensis]
MSTASAPIPATARKIAPTFVWSTMSSRTTTRRASRSTSATAGSGGRCMAASAPRCRLYPVSRSSTAAAPTNTGTSGKPSRSGATSSSHCSCTSTDRGT